MKKIAVVLSGSGYLDGSEIREAVGVLWSLSEHQVEVQCFAPDEPQKDVVNHLSGQPQGEERNILTESARIARGKIEPLSSLTTEDWDGVIFPGGFGAAKSLSNFAEKGADGEVHPKVKSIIEEMHAARKPIGAICIAPALVALTLKNKGVELTVGVQGDAASAIEATGNKHIVCSANGEVNDESHRVISTPAYMYDNAPLHEVFKGIHKCVHEVVRLAHDHPTAS